MPWRHIRQLAKDGVALLLIEGQGLEAGCFEVEIGDALVQGVLLHGAKQAGAPAILANALVYPEPVHMQPAPLDVGEDAPSTLPSSSLIKLAICSL